MSPQSESAPAVAPSLTVASEVKEDPRKNFKPHPTPTPFSEHVYAVKDGKELLLRVWPSAEANESSPWILWAHGGAWTFGAHVRPNPWIIPSFRHRGYHIVSWAYRYTPHVGIEEIIQDGIDAYTWSRKNLPTLHSISGKINVDRAIVGGQSAGGNIATLLGHHLSPSPKAIIDVYGPVDFTDPHFIKITPEKPFRSFENRYTEAEIEKGMKDRDVKKALSIAPGPHELENINIEDVRESWAMPNLTYTEEIYFHGDVMRYMSAKGMLIRTLLRAERFGDDEDAFIEYAKRWSPLWILEEKKTYPPTWILHGEEDASVPISQARMFEAKLKEFGVPVGTSYESGEHLHDFKYTSPDVPGWNENIVPAVEFLDKHARS